MGKGRLPQSASSSSSSEQAPLLVPGRLLLPVTTWPCAKLPRGVAVLSAAAAGSLECLLLVLCWRCMAYLRLF